jgi:hypothetical protein
VGRRGKRARLRDHLLGLVLVYLVGYFLLRPRYGIGIVLLLGFVVFLVWFLFLMPTRCDFEVKGRGCRRRVRGKVGGCHDHARDKRDAIFAAFRMRNPGVAFRLMWRDGAQAGRRLGAEPVPTNPAASAANRSQALFNAASLVVAVISAVAGVLALFVAA